MKKQKHLSIVGNEKPGFDPASHVANYLAEEGWKVLPLGQLEHPTHGQETTKEVGKRINQDFIAGKGKPGRGYKETFIDALQIEVKAEVRRLRKELVEKLICTSENLEQLQDLIRAVTGREDELDVKVMAHFIWQIKRKLNDLPVYNHVMPFLYGKQGGGKSTAVRQLLSPIKAYSTSLRVAEACDDRYQYHVAQSLACLFDEFQIVKREHIEMVKSLITSEMINSRKLGSNEVPGHWNYCTFIATSNHPLDTLFPDSTGMRRFYQIACADKLDWDALNTIDFMALFQGIDESKDKGYIDDSISNRLKEHQRELTAVDPVDDFLEEIGAKVRDRASAKRVSAREIYAEYTQYCALSGVIVPNLAQFSKDLVRLGFEESGRCTLNKKRLKAYLVDKDCSVGTPSDEVEQ